MMVEEQLAWRNCHCHPMYICCLQTNSNRKYV